MNIEKDVLQSCIRKERRAQFQLYRSCYNLLMSICVRYKNNREDAEAILNQGFMKILNKLETYREEVPFEAWVSRIMINTIIDEYRKNKKANELLEYGDLEKGTIIKHHMDYNEAEKAYDAAELENMLKTLPDISRKVFNLFAIDGYTHKEIGEMLGMSEGTSKWHVSSARNKLRMLLNRSNINTGASSADRPVRKERKVI